MFRECYRNYYGLSYPKLLILSVLFHINYTILLGELQIDNLVHSLTGVTVP